MTSAVAATPALSDAAGGVEGGEFAGSPVHENRGPAMQVIGGHPFYPLDPRAEDFDIATIATALSRLARYNGHTTKFYSVAQHSVLASRLVPAEIALEALLHDAAEAYLGDVTRPVKRVLEGIAPGAWRVIEARVEQAIAERFGLVWPWPAEIGVADAVMAATEKRDLMDPARFEWGPLPPPADFTIVPWSMRIARIEFKYVFKKLQARGGLPSFALRASEGRR